MCDVPSIELKSQTRAFVLHHELFVVPQLFIRIEEQVSLLVIRDDTRDGEIERDDDERFVLGMSWPLLP